MRTKSKLTAIEKKIAELAKKNPPSQWKKRLAYDIKNSDWLKKSANVAFVILEILDERKMSKAQLTQLIKVSDAKLSKILKGQENLTLKTITQIEAGLGIKLGKVLDEDENS